MKVLKVMGKGNVSVEPDMVTLSFDVETKSKDYAKSIQLLNTRADDLRNSLAASGFKKTELKTSAFNIHVETQYKDGEHVFNGYVASHKMSIEMPSEKALLNTVFGHISKGHSGAEIHLAFSVKDKDALRKKVLTKAVEKAKENAATLAAAAGVKLGKLQQMDYGWAEVRIYDREADLCCSKASASSCSEVDIEPENVAAEDNVTMVYEIIE